MEFDEDSPPELVATATSLASPLKQATETLLDGASMVKVPITIVTGSEPYCVRKTNHS